MTPDDSPKGILEAALQRIANEHGIVIRRMTVEWVDFRKISGEEEATFNKLEIEASVLWPKNV